LAAEQRAVFGYALLGAHLHGSPHLALAIRCSDAHHKLAGNATSAISSAGHTPIAPAADYPDLYPVRSRTAALTLASELEDFCAAAWRFLYARAAEIPGAREHRLRADAQRALTASAVRAVRWRETRGAAHASVPFPGL
jgi:hypothetical protein